MHALNQRPPEARGCSCPPHGYLQDTTQAAPGVSVQLLAQPGQPGQAPFLSVRWGFPQVPFALQPVNQESRTLNKTVANLEEGMSLLTAASAGGHERQEQMQVPH